MARKPNVNLPPKKHAHERYRGGPLFIEKWSNAKVALVGYRTGQGRTSTVIAAELADGTIPETIRHMWKIWKIPYNGNAVEMRFPISPPDRALLVKRAAAEGLTPEQWLAIIAKYAIRDDMFNAISGV